MAKSKSAPKASPVVVVSDVLALPKYQNIPQYAPSFGGSIVWKSLADIRDNPRNPRDMEETPGAVYALALSIRSSFLKKPLVCKPDGTLLKGHIRSAALRILEEIDPAFLPAEGVPVEVVNVTSREQEDALLFDHSDAEQPLQVIGMMNTLIESFSRLPRPSEFQVMVENATLMNLALGGPKEGEFVNKETGLPLTNDAKLRLMFGKRKLWLQRANFLQRLPNFVREEFKAWHRKLNNNAFDASTGQLGKLGSLFETANQFGAKLSKTVEVEEIPTMAESGLDDSIIKAIRSIDNAKDRAGFVAKLPTEVRGIVAGALFREEWEAITVPGAEKAKTGKLRSFKEVSDMRKGLLAETGNAYVDKLLAWIMSEVDDVTDLKEVFSKN